jgi:phosphatidylglycerol:prolipoprotein diacylglycerol transferase
VQPEIHIFGLTLQSFGLMMGLGFVVAGICATRHIQELGKPQDWGYEMIFAALVGGLIGARLWWIGENWSDAKDDVLGSLFSGTGLVWYGGAFGGAIAVLAWAAWRRWLSLSMLDVAAVGLAAGYAIGRIGCQLSGDGDYGKPWDGPWAMSYPHGTVPTERTVHPTPIYETLAMGLGAWLLWQLRDRVRAGVLFALYLLYAGAERFLVEFIRRNTEAVAGLTSAQLESLGMMVAGTLWIAMVVSRHGGIGRPAANDAMQTTANFRAVE